ncbi:unnamed protein product [Prunus armeniaca]
MELLMRAKQLVLHLKIQAGQVSVLKFCNFIVCQGYHTLYQWYRLVESEHFPDPTGLRARIEQWTFGLHPACIKYFMSALDVPDVMAVTRNNICKNGMESLSRAGAIIYYASVFLYFWVFSTPSFTRFHIKSDGDLEVYTLAVDKVPKE